MADPVQTAAERIEILLADDHAMVRGGLRRVLETETGVRVVAEAGDVEAALEQARQHQPRIVLLDLNMGGRSTLSAIPEFLNAVPGSAVIVLTMEGDPAFAREAMREGARGYVLKEAAEGQLLEAVYSVAAGRTYLDPGLGARMASSREPAEALPGLSRGDPERAVGATFAGHRIDAVLGRGGMGLVFRATDCALDRPVALKVIAPEVSGNRAFRVRFERECRVAAGIDHPHVVEIFHAGEEDGLLYLTMRYIDGIDLARLLRSQGPMVPRRAVSILAQIADALDEAHRVGCVHRDVKPANILIAQRPGGEHAFLTDFGITKRVAGEPSQTRTAVAVGSPDYVAPEQAQAGEVGPRADVYSLGCVLFESLTGALPFDRDTDLQKLWAHVYDPPPTLRSIDPELPPGLEPVLDRALAKDPDRRYPSTGELARAMFSAVEG